MLETHIRMQNEYGSLFKIKGMFGRRDMLISYDPHDFERVYRTEGLWPLRRGNETFAYYRKKVRPDLFRRMGGLLSEHGEKWAEMRSKVNPVMLQPKTVKMYIPTIDAVASDFLTFMAAKRDANNEVPASFGADLNKWALESIGVIALNQRLGVLSGHSPRADLLMQSVRSFLELGYELEILPSLWKYFSTPKYKQLMQAYDNMTE